MTIDEAQLLANVNERAQRLYQDGYHAAWLDEHTVEVTNDEGTSYEIDTLFETCTCPFYTERKGRYPCKHILGYDKLLHDQEQAREQQRERAAQQQSCCVH